MRGVAQADVDVVVAGLTHRRRFRWAIAERAVDGARHTAAAIDAIVVLMELIAVDGIGGVPGKVVQQVQRVFGEIGIRFPQSGIIGLREPR